MSDRTPLIGLDDNPPSPSYGADDEKEEDDEDPNNPKEPIQPGVQSGKPSSKRKKGTKRLPRDSSLDKVDENAEFEPGKEFQQSGIGCSDMSFGVKSYLHNFYDSRFYKDPNMYEEEDGDYRYLLHPYPRKRRCTSIWWKIFVWIGANFLVFGIIGVLVGYLVQEKDILVATVDKNIGVIDKEAITYNFNLNVCKLVGLILFCIGGLTLTVALLFPSFLYQYFDEDRKGEGSFKVNAGNAGIVSYGAHPPSSPLEKNIPVSGVVASVQPERKSNEAILTKEGMVPYKD